MEGYCLKDKKKVEMVDPQPIRRKNGKPATVGTCPICGTKIWRSGKSTQSVFCRGPPPGAVLSFSGSVGDRWLERREQDVGCRHRIVDAEHLEDLDVGRIVDPSDRLLDIEMLLRHL